MDSCASGAVTILWKNNSGRGSSGYAHLSDLIRKVVRTENVYIVNIYQALVALQMGATRRFSQMEWQMPAKPHEQVICEVAVGG